MKDLKEQIADMIVQDYLFSNDTPLDTADKILALIRQAVPEPIRERYDKGSDSQKWKDGWNDCRKKIMEVLG